MSLLLRLNTLVKTAKLVPILTTLTNRFVKIAKNEKKVIIWFFSEELIAKSVSDFNVCYNEKAVCERCTEKGHTVIVPSLTACSSCLEHDLQCARRVVLVVILDCESGNKHFLKQLKKELIEGTLEPSLCFVISVPFTRLFAYYENTFHKLVFAVI